MSSFRCECGDEACTCAIRLTAVEYESVRAYATHFAIASNHENPEIEQLVEEHERFAVVETVSGEAAKLARRSYPRQWHGQRRSTEPLETRRQVPGGEPSHGPPGIPPPLGRTGAFERERSTVSSPKTLPTLDRRWRRVPAGGIELLNVHWHGLRLR